MSQTRKRALLQVGLVLVGCWVIADPGMAGEGVRASRAQLQDAWLSSDVAVVGIYKGTHPQLGERYHVVDVTDVWMGTPPLGELVFKAPRGVRAERHDEVLLFLWDRLAGATDSFIEMSRRRHGEDFIEQIGPDSLASYLLPFSRYAFPFEDGSLVLRGTSVFTDKLSKRELRSLLLDYELTLQPKAQFERADAVVHGRITRKDIKTKTVEGVAVEFVVSVDCKQLQALKGTAPDPVVLQFGSFPRSPRFDADEEVILFLSQGEDGLFLKDGKRAVFHVIDGAVAETAQPLREFVRMLRQTGG